MQGHQITQMPLFVDGNLEKFVPSNHLLRKVDRILDLKFVRRITRECYAGKGRPSLRRANYRGLAKVPTDASPPKILK